MMVLITYDVDTISETGEKRLRKVAKLCRDYGQRVQNSVFECRLTESQFVILKNKISSIIDNELDNVRFYLLGNNWNRRIETIGKNNLVDLDEELII
ncbi:MAG: CRISPR-associated endonuclease Cas2 [Alistipes sp.]|nr:CRISPR-associated endonuclease Cas2 [Alistipes sp.]MBR5893450.1 CRISPR-associated endonuclease Cas2 [Bacteroidaceae bacterium]